MQCQNAEYGKTEAELPRRVEDFVRHSYVMYADKKKPYRFLGPWACTVPWHVSGMAL